MTVRSLVATVGFTGGQTANTSPPQQFLAATLAGAGGLTGDVLQRGITASFAGSGALSTPPFYNIAVVRVTLAGAGALSLDILPQQYLNAALAASGSVVADVTVSKAPVNWDISAALGGAGLLAAPLYAVETVTATMTIASSLAADVLPQQYASAALVGAGSLTSAVLLTERIAISLAVSGSLSSNVTLLGGSLISISAALAGSGILLADSPALVLLRASLSPSGLLAIDAAPEQFVATSLSGIGALNSNALLYTPLSATFETSGSLAAGLYVSMTAQLAAALEADGSLSTDVPALIGAAAILDGSGALSAEAEVVKATALFASFLGAAALSAELGQFVRKFKVRVADSNKFVAAVRELPGDRRWHLSSKYQVDSLIDLSAVFTDNDGVTPVDPADVAVYIRTPDGTVVRHTNIERLDVGTYSLAIEVTRAGPWVYKWRGSGNCEIASPDTYFQVVESAVINSLEGRCYDDST